MILRNNRIIDRPIRIIMATNAISNNISEVDGSVDNSKMAVTTASPQEAEKAVGPSSEINTGQGQVNENVDEIQIIGPEINANEQTNSNDKSVGPGERETEVEKDPTAENQNFGSMGQDPLLLIMSKLAGMEQSMEQKLSNMENKFSNVENKLNSTEQQLENKFNSVENKLGATEQKLSQIVENKLNERDRNAARDNERNKIELIGRIADQIG